MTPAQAVQIQSNLRDKVVAKGRVAPKLVAGADLAFFPHSDHVVACVMVFSGRIGFIAHERRAGARPAAAATRNRDARVDRPSTDLRLVMESTA